MVYLMVYIADGSGTVARNVVHFDETVKPFGQFSEKGRTTVNNFTSSAVGWKSIGDDFRAVIRKATDEEIVGWFGLKMFREEVRREALRLPKDGD